MSKICTYKTFTFEGEEITSEDAVCLKRYFIRFYEDGQVKRTQTFVNSQLTGTCYYCGESEVKSILTTDPNAGVFFSVFENGYKVSFSLSFQDGNLSHKTVYVTNALDELICFQPFSVDPEKPNFRLTEKSYYEDGINILRFYYDNDGTCFEVVRQQEYQTDFLASQIGVNPQIDFTWEGFEYYKFAMPMIPQG